MVMLPGTPQPAALLVPSGAITDQHSMSICCDLRAGLLQVLVHRLGIDGRHNDGSADPTGRTNCAEQMHRIMTVVADHRRPRADRRPDIGDRTLLADPRFWNYTSIGLPRPKPAKPRQLGRRSFF